MSGYFMTMAMRLYGQIEIGWVCVAWHKLTEHTMTMTAWHSYYSTGRCVQFSHVAYDVCECGMFGDGIPLEENGKVS